LPAVGFKFGHWSDSIMVQCPLGPGDTSAPGPLGAARAMAVEVMRDTAEALKG
jgi:hypothetical protein